jgi:hypothetical protein
MRTTDTTTIDRPGPVDDGSWPPPDDWVPVEERLLGLDKRTLWPGLVVLAVWVVFVHVVPAINDAIDFDNPVESGDVVDLGNEELTFVPSVGWNLEDGVLLDEQGISPVALGSGAALVSEETISFAVQTAPWDGDADELLDQVLDIEDALDSVIAEDVADPIDIVNVDGVPGVLAPFRGTEKNGFVATYVFDAVGEDADITIGVSATVIGDPSTDSEFAEDVVAMLQSITYHPIADQEDAG